MKQMPEESEKFQQVDGQWRDVMESTYANPSCIAVARDKEKLALLQENNMVRSSLISFNQNLGWPSEAFESKIHRSGHPENHLLVLSNRNIDRINVSQKKSI